MHAEYVVFVVKVFYNIDTNFHQNALLLFDGVKLHVRQVHVCTFTHSFAECPFVLFLNLVYGRLNSNLEIRFFSF